MGRRAAAAGAAASAALLFAGAAAAQSAPAASDPREFNTDRPDTTESPFTVSPGRLQFETTLFGFSRSHRDPDGVRTDAYEAGTTNMRIGLTPRLEADVVLQPYGRVRTSDHRGDGEGPGDLTLRAKLNLWGADGVEKPGATAAALLPFVDIPLDRSNNVGDAGVGGGLILPFDVKLAEHFELGLNAGVHVVREDLERGYDAQVLLSASLGQEWSKTVSTYYEIAAELNRSDPRGEAVYANTGVTWKVRDNVQLDAGVNLGATRGADRFTLFVGAAARF